MSIASRRILVLFCFCFLLNAAFAQKSSKKKNKSESANTASANSTSTDQAKKEEGDPGFKGRTWGLVGPFRGGRVLGVTGVVGQPNTYYFGGVGGGVWKTTDGGISWVPMSDKEKFSSVGAIAVAESDPNVIYVVTGEACIRNNILQGNGVYKSTDASKTGNFTGLENTRHIRRLAVHPGNPSIIFVPA